MRLRPRPLRVRAVLSLVGIAYAAGILTMATLGGTFRVPEPKNVDLGLPPSPLLNRWGIELPRHPAREPIPTVSSAEPSTTTGTAGDAMTPVEPRIESADDRHLTPRLAFPIEGLDKTTLHSMFEEPRGSRRHEALDILAPRHTPVHAVDSGRIVKLFYSAAGGVTAYQFDSTETWCYYYAHLERYADGLAEGQRIERGQIIGFVGTSGNAPKDTPHLHFAIFRLDADKQWWKGEAIDPYPLLK